MWYEIFAFEIRYRIKRLDTYIYFLAIFLFSLVGVDFIFGETDLGAIKENSSYVLSHTMAALSGIFMVVTSLIMGVPVLRDYTYNMEPLLFASPLNKGDYLLGRFLGSFLILVLVFSGMLWGIIIGEFMPWRAPDRLLPFQVETYLQAFLQVVFPTLFYGGAIFFVSGALSRNLIVVYTQGICFFLVLMLTRSIEHPFISALLDPFGLSTLDAMIEFWTALEKNSQMIPMQGVLLYNRLLWVCIGLGALFLGYHRFNFGLLKRKGSNSSIKEIEEENHPPTSGIEIPDYTSQKGSKAHMAQLYYQTLFYLKSVFKETSFWALMICGILIIFINGISLGTSYGINSYPTTYLIIEELHEMSIFFFLIILVFYSGELVWKERGAKLALIFDALPVFDSLYVTSKLIALLLIYLILMCTLWLAGILFQTYMGYYEYEMGVYFNGFFLELFPFLALFTFVSIFLQVLLNYKFIAYILMLFFIIGTEALGIMGFDHGLYKFGADNLGTYSDMNGYGHFLEPYIWFKVYWFAFSIALFVPVVLFSIRGTDTGFKTRWKLAKQKLSKPLLSLAGSALFIFTIVGAYIFYNTHVLNEYWSNEAQDAFRANYEKTLKKNEYLAQPKVVDVNIRLELYPLERNYRAEGQYILVNKHKEAIPAIHVQKRLDAHVEIEHLKFEGGARIDKEYEQYGYIIYILNHALQPGDSLKMEFTQTYTTRGFREKPSDTEIVYNGTFFNSDDFPGFGYNRKYELRNKDEREKFGLTPRKHMPQRDHKQGLANARSGDDGYEINFEMLISTDTSQIAVVPGYLEKTWTEGKRRYFHYKMDQPIIHFYPIVSAKYEVLRDVWMPSDSKTAPPVELEIYYHKGHEYNLDRMMQSMKASLAYYTRHFSPYPYRQMRIMEVPRYVQTAQSYPNTVPFSEALGFVMEVDDKTDVDMPFFITAHELAHQWWGLQVVAADVQGRSMILESLAQYSALMVMKHNFSEEKLQQLLALERKRYLMGRTKEAQTELPLAQVENQKYIFYRKGAINLFTLQDYISEERVNLAIRRFIKDWNAFGARKEPERYASSTDLLDYFRAVTPDSLSYLISDLFETVTLYENKIVKGTYEELSEDEYLVNLNFDTRKYQVDSLGVEKDIAINDWIDIGIYGVGEAGEDSLLYLKKHTFTQAETQVTIRVKGVPTKAAIDPKFRLMDRNVADNVGVLLEK